MRLELRVARGYLKRSFYSEDTLSHVMAGMGMLLAQSVIVSNQFFDEAEIRKYLSIRRQYHETFVAACEGLAEACAAGTFGTAAKVIAHPLQQVAAIPAKDAQRALRLAAKALRGLKSVLAELPREDRRVFRLIRMAYQLAASTDKAYNSEHVEFLQELLKVQSLPAPIRTMFRKAIKYAASMYGRYDDMANVGAWFEMPPERKKKIHETMVEAVKTTSAIYEKYKEDPEGQQKALVENQKRIQRLKNVAGVNVQIIEGFEGEEGESGPSLEEALKKESKLQADGPTEFVQEKIERYFQASFAEKGTLPREYGKILTQLKKARTLDTVRRVLKGAKQRRLIYSEAVDQLEQIWAQAGKNLAVKRGVKLVPLQWEPISVEDFQKKHSTGKVVFDDAMDEKTRQETLGRVSRAIGDLEGIFGKGFCGKHAKPLEFNFEGSTGMAAASYFGWENRNNWQPRVKFGDDYAGLLAHELSHYFDDLLANKIDRVKNPEGYDKLRREYGPGSSELFGRTGVDLEYWVGSKSKEYVSSVIPELGEFADAVVATPDFKRWKDMAGSPHDTALPQAIENLTGQHGYDLPKDHPYARMLFDAPRYKKDWPPELLAETEKVYKQITDGDSRKLTYYNSGTEVWARMCEQYVATKLADAGIANPWLTQLTYDLDELPQMMDQATFEEKIVPLLDKIFATIKEKSLVASRVAARYLEAKGKAKGLSLLPDFDKAVEKLEGGDNGPMLAFAEHVVSVLYESSGKEWMAGLSVQKINALNKLGRAAQFLSRVHWDTVKAHPGLLASTVREVKEWRKGLRTLEIASTLGDEVLEIKRGPFAVVPIPGLTKAEMEGALEALDAATAKLRVKCPKVLYGKVFFSKHIQKNTSARYSVNQDALALNVLAKKRFDDIFTIIHELGHRHEYKFLSKEGKTKYWDLSTRKVYEKIQFDGKLREQVADEAVQLAKLKATGKPLPPPSESLIWWLKSPHPHQQGDVRQLTSKYLAGTLDEKELHDAVKGERDESVMTDKVLRGPLHVTPYGATKPGENYADGFAHFILDIDMPAELAAILADELK